MDDSDKNRSRRKVGRPRIASPNPVDVHVGKRVRLRRNLLGMSQEKLGAQLGLTFQQVQKYERGANRIGASRLYEIARILDVPLSFFFDDLPDDVVQQYRRVAPGMAEGEQAPYGADPLSKRETLELVRAYYRIRDENVRRRVFELAKSVGQSYNGLTDEDGLGDEAAG